VIKTTVNSISAASSSKEQTVVSGSFLIKQIGCSIAYIEFRVALGECSFFVFFILGADVFTEPEVVLFITFFVGVIVG
jgi:hypothetical protein